MTEPMNTLDDLEHWAESVSAGRWCGADFVKMVLPGQNCYYEANSAVLDVVRLVKTQENWEQIGPARLVYLLLLKQKEIRDKGGTDGPKS